MTQSVKWKTIRMQGPINYVKNTDFGRLSLIRIMKSGNEDEEEKKQNSFHLQNVLKSASNEHSQNIKLYFKSIDLLHLTVETNHEHSPYEY